MSPAQPGSVRRGYHRKSYLKDSSLGTLGEIFDGQPPFTPQDCIAQAWTVAKVLRTWHVLQPSANRETKENTLLNN
ncbi:MAG TPA: hypothetical protein DD706_24250 [Nitrospiraceae bacterium]|nr:hypothetical protein [Nitrospiraceae bacterium]